MQDLQILEQQQQEAKRKLVSAQSTKQKRLDQLRQLNTLLEDKNFSNGTLRAKLQQSRDFLSIATRDLGNRKLTTDRLQVGIADFESKLKRGLNSAKMIQVCGAKIDSFQMVIEHKIENINRLRMEQMQTSTEVRVQYEQTETKDREFRMTIQDAHKRSREWGEEKVSLRNHISKLDDDKLAAQNAEQMTELQIQGAQDSIKIEEDRIASLKRKLRSEIEDATKKNKKKSSEIKAGFTSIMTLRNKVQEYQEKIFECREIEGHPQVKDFTLVFVQNVFRGDLARIEEETKREEHDLLALKKSIETTELACRNANERTLQNDKEASLLVASTKSLTEEEEKRQKSASDFQYSLEYGRAEVTKLEQNFQELEKTRKSEAQANLTAIADYDVEIGQQTKVVEDLKLNIHQADISLKTKIRLFEETEKLPLFQKLEKTKSKSTTEERKYQDFLHQSSEASIESKLQADFELKIYEEATNWETKNEMMISRCEQHLQSK